MPAIAFRGYAPRRDLNSHVAFALRKGTLAAQCGFCGYLLAVSDIWACLFDADLGFAGYLVANKLTPSGLYVGQSFRRVVFSFVLRFLYHHTVIIDIVVQT